MRYRGSRPVRLGTIGGLVNEGARRFRAARLTYGHGTASARSEAAYLAFHELSLTHEDPEALLGRRVHPKQAQRVLRAFERRIRERRPAAYLTREAWLEGVKFHVDKRVIVPRSHIAGMLSDRLVPWISEPGRVARVLDLCTGSGCLAVLAALAFPRAKITAADISAGALAVARINVARHRMRRRIKVVRSDLFSALGRGRYDVIVCNPPYVTSRSMQRLPAEYRREPRLALAGGKDGLDLVRTILLQATDYLRPGGLLVMEVGSGGARVERAFPRISFTWAETPGGGDVLVASREQLLPPVPPVRARRSARGLRSAPARYIPRA